MKTVPWNNLLKFQDGRWMTTEAEAAINTAINTTYKEVLLDIKSQTLTPNDCTELAEFLIAVRDYINNKT